MLVLAALVPLAMGLSPLIEPDPRGYGTHEQLGLPPCGIHAGLGAPCPACGVTTAVVLSWRGEVRASLLAQPFGFVLSLAAPAFALWVLAMQVAGRDAWKALTRARLRVLAASAVLLGSGAWAWTLTTYAR